MRLSVTINNRPAIIVGYAPNPNGKPYAIVIGLSDFPEAVALSDCRLPRLPKKLLRRVKRATRQKTIDTRREVVENLLVQ